MHPNSRLLTPTRSLVLAYSLTRLLAYLLTHVLTYSLTCQVRGNRIHHQKMGGVWVYKGAGGLFEDNDIYANAKVR